jgi:hypothetical protein
MSQTKKQSFIEANINTLAGFLISYITLQVINQIYDLSLTLWSSFEITLIFTLMSIVRNYAIRRFFNRSSK